MSGRTLIFLAAWAVLRVPSAFADNYTFTRLTPGGSVGEFNLGGINNNDVVLAEVNGHLFTYDVHSGTYTNYNSLLPSQMGRIDDSGNFVYTTNVGGSFKGTIYDPSTNSTTFFLDPNSPQYTFASGVSGNGLIAGYYLNSSFNQPGFTKNGSTFTDVSYPGPHGQIYLWDVNNSGDVVGQSSCCRAGVNFLKQGSTYTTILDPLGSAANGSAYGLNDNDQVVGWYDNGSGGPINGFLWENGVSTTFNYPGASSTVLADINDNGLIFGAAVDASGTFLFVATPDPVPEPTSVVLLGSLLLIVAGSCRLAKFAQRKST